MSKSMENILVYDKVNDERKALTERIRDNTARLSDAQLKMWECEGYESVSELIAKNIALQMAVMEISGGRDIELSQMLRRNKKQIEMMLVANASISPMEYITPDIRACSLLMRPFTQEQLEKVVHSFVAAYFRNLYSEDTGASLLIGSRQGVTAVPFDSIYYIEARSKRIFIRQQDREYSKYDSLENIRATLPDYFMQSHRSYIFNTHYLESVSFSDNLIHLENGITIPLARTYKGKIKEFLNGR